MKSSGGGAWCFRRRRSSEDIGDELLAGLLARERAGDSPRTTSSLSAEKNPCFRSIFTTLPHAGEANAFVCSEMVKGTHTKQVIRV